MMDLDGSRFMHGVADIHGTWHACSFAFILTYFVFSKINMATVRTHVVLALLVILSLATAHSATAFDFHKLKFWEKEVPAHAPINAHASAPISEAIDAPASAPTKAPKFKKSPKHKKVAAVPAPSPTPLHIRKYGRWSLW